MSDPPACGPVATQRDPPELPAPPPFVPCALDKYGRRSGDAINVIFLGRGGQIDSAFRQAGWVAARPASVWAIHRIDPDVDGERDVIATTLESVGCADLLDYLHLPGAGIEGRTIDGQRFVTDGRSAVIRLHACPPVPTAQADTTRPVLPPRPTLPSDSTSTDESP
jgi:hypothetical protein